MSRLGDLLHQERTRRKLSAKAVAKLAGVNEKYILDVEAGTRIIQDDQARRILAKMGMEQQAQTQFSLDDIAATVDLQAAIGPERFQQAKQVEKQEAVKADGSIWLDALRGVVQSVPIYNAVNHKVGSRLLPVAQGKIEGAPAEKVFYFKAPDNRMRGFRVQQGDLVLVVPSQEIQEGRMLLLETGLGRQLFVVQQLPRYQLLLQSFDLQSESQVLPMNEVKVLGLCVRLEADL